MNMKTVVLVFLAYLAASSRVCLADIEPVSFVDPSIANSLSANGYSAVSEISPDGRYVVFESIASNLATNDYNYCADVFLRDRQSGTTILISANPDGFSGYGGSSGSSMSTNGAWVSFESDADDLAARDDNGVTDVFLRSVTLGQTSLVSVNTNGTSANGPSTFPIITPDGRFVAFESAATDLVTNMSAMVNTRGSGINVYMRDLSSNATFLASVSSNGLAGGDGESKLSAVSADGRYVLFSSIAKNIGAPLNSGRDIYLRDIQAQSNYWVSTNVAQLLGVGKYIKYSANCFNPVMSGDGRSIAFRVIKDYSSLVVRHDLASNTTLVISSNRYPTIVSPSDYTGPAISDDGGVIAYAEVDKKYINTTTNQIYVWDFSSKTNTMVTWAPDGKTFGNAGSDCPVLSADGSTLAFLSAATNLVAGTSAEAHVRLYLRDLAAGVTKLGNQETNPSKPLGDVLEYPVLSADGSLAAFGCSSDGLVDSDNNGVDDVFINHTETGIIELVSSRSPALDFTIASSGSFIAENGLSRDGRFAVFSTAADNMVAGDTNVAWDIFVRDLQTKDLILVSGNVDGTGTGNGSSMLPCISTDGNLVAFQSEASDLVSGDTNKTTDVFLYDLATRETRLVSAAYGGTGSALGASESPVITPDGLTVFFRSKAKNLTSKTFSDSIPKLYACDIADGTNVVISFDNLPITNPLLLDIASDSQLVAFVGNASLGAMPLYIHDISAQISEKIDTITSQTLPLATFSGDGRWLAYLNAVTTKSNNLILRDLVAKTNLTLGVDGGVWRMSFNGDGSRLAYEALGTGSMPTNTHQIFVFDRARGSTILVSATVGGDNGGNGDSRNPIISQDGRYVYFNSHATDLANVVDQQIWADVFVRDLNDGTTRLLSVNRFKTGAGNSQSVLRALSADGKVVAIESLASDLVPMDLNMSKDVFVLRVDAALEDSDNDGLSDSWEIEYFGSLVRNGVGDFDNDGMSDGAEFLAGTVPTDKESALIVIQIGKPAETGRLITWQAIPGKTYRIQYKTSLNDAAWVDLEGTVQAEAATASKADATTAGNSQRFYRVLLVH